MHCPYCQSNHAVRKGLIRRKSGELGQRYLCWDCKRQFNDRSGTPVAHIRKPVEQVERVVKMRSEGMGIRAAGRVESIAPATVALWEKRLANQTQAWSPAVLAESEITVEGDEVYTRVEKNHPASKVKDGH